MEILLKKLDVVMAPPNIPVAHLKEENGSRSIYITLNIISLRNLIVAIDEIETPRPTIHAVYINSLQTLGADIKKIVIDDFIDGIFDSKIYITTKENSVQIINCHVTDALVIAVIKNCPIVIVENIFLKLEEESKRQQGEASESKALKILENIDPDKLIKH